LRLAGITTLEEANQFLRQHYLAEMNQKFAVPAGQSGHAFVPVPSQDLEQIFSVQTERTVDHDNTGGIREWVWQIERTRWRGTLAGCRVTICERLDGQVSIVYGPHVVGRYTPQGALLGAAPRSPGLARRFALPSPKGGAFRAKRRAKPTAKARTKFRNAILLVR
jgi:hypothetical protein